ncbi:hypothetical protein ACJX0J_023525, partial [Zea mays]
MHHLGQRLLVRERFLAAQRHNTIIYRLSNNQKSKMQQQYKLFSTFLANIFIFRGGTSKNPQRQRIQQRRHDWPFLVEIIADQKFDRLYVVFTCATHERNIYRAANYESELQVILNTCMDIYYCYV